jgi:hypothetical protein
MLMNVLISPHPGRAFARPSASLTGEVDRQRVRPEEPAR